MKSEFKNYKHFTMESSAEETAGFYYLKLSNLEEGETAQWLSMLNVQSWRQEFRSQYHITDISQAPATPDPRDPSSPLAWARMCLYVHMGLECRHFLKYVLLETPLEDMYASMRTPSTEH